MRACADIDAVVAQVKTSERTSILPVLLEGAAGSGKTALVANLVRYCAFLRASRQPLMTTLIKKSHFDGKSDHELPTHTQAIEESFPFTKFISPEKLVGMSDGQRVAKIQQVSWV